MDLIRFSLRNPIRGPGWSHSIMLAGFGCHSRDHGRHFARLQKACGGEFFSPTQVFPLWTWKNQ